MFGLFKSKRQKLLDKHQKLTEEAFRLSKTNRKLSDEKTAEAEKIMQQIEQLDAEKS